MVENKGNKLIVIILISIIVIMFVVFSLLIEFGVININFNRLTNNIFNYNISNKEEDNGNIKIKLPAKLEGTLGFKEISYTKYAEKLDGDDPFVVVIINEGCRYCEMFEPVVEQVAYEYELPISYINLANLSDDERNALAISNSYLRRNQWGTPTTLFLYGDKVVDSISGYVDRETFVDFIKENFVIR